MGRVFEEAASRRGAAVAAAPPTTRRCCATAPTVRTRASGSSCATSARHWRGRSSRSSRSVLAGGGVVRGFNAGAREVPRRARRAHRARAPLRRRRARVGVRAGGRDAGARRPRSSSRTRSARRSRRRSAPQPGDLLLLVADHAAVAATALGELRLELARRFGLLPRAATTLLWVVDFPMFEWNDGEERWDAMHHPFTAPTGDRSSDPGSAALARVRHRARRLRRSAAARSVSTGPRCSSRSSTRSGSPRRRRERASASCSRRCATARRRTAASRSGIDRLVALLAGRDSIRDVIAFPKTASGADPLTGAPAPVDARQLAELGIRVVAPPRG